MGDVDNADVTSLDAYTVYELRVMGENAVGRGRPSAPRDAQTDEARMFAPAAI